MLIFIIATLTIFGIANSGRIVFEGEERRNHRRRKRPCRDKSADGRTFFDINYSNVNNHYYYICGGQLSTGSNGVLHKPDQSTNGGGLLGGGLFSGSHLNGGGLLGGILSDSNEQTENNDDVIVADEYDKPDSASNPLVNVAESVQNTVVGVTNAVTGTVQDIARPLLSSIQSAPQTDKIFSNNANGFFFGLFDGSLINSFINKRPSSGSSSSTPQPFDKPVTEIYDDVEDPNQNYKPGTQGIGNNPVNGQYMIEDVNLMPSNLINRGINNFVNPFLELFY